MGRGPGGHLEAWAWLAAGPLTVGEEKEKNVLASSQKPSTTYGIGPYIFLVYNYIPQV
jgi:hypothetical protein